MPSSTRRAFLQTTAAGAAMLSLPTARAAGANERIVLALIGCGGRGSGVAQVFRNTKGVEVAWVCDPDSERLKKAADKFEIPAERAVADMRRVLDNKDVTAVLIATPDHWHSPAAILACEAGKHVYVEKPCSHNVREGRLLVDAARRNKTLVQHGTQCRSTGMMKEAIAQLREGVIGPVLMAKAWNVQRRGGIGRPAEGTPPAGFDYDTWVGPATMAPYQANRIQGGWHWWYDFGTGDFGNDGVHDIDYARWGLGVETHPSLISAIGGKFVLDGDEQFPDTQQVAFEYPGDGSAGDRKLLVYEQRLWSSNYPFNVDSGVEFYGPKGQMFLSRRGKLQVLNDKNQKVELGIAGEAQNEVAHVGNLCEAIRSGVPLNAEIEIGHVSASLCHLGNIATRVGRTLKFNPKTERIVGDDESDRLLSRHYRDHWGKPREA